MLKQYRVSHALRADALYKNELGPGFFFSDSLCSCSTNAAVVLGLLPQCRLLWTPCWLLWLQLLKRVCTSSQGTVAARCSDPAMGCGPRHVTTSRGRSFRAVSGNAASTPSSAQRVSIDVSMRVTWDCFIRVSLSDPR